MLVNIVQSGSTTGTIPSSGPHTVAVSIACAPLTAGNTVIVAFGSRADGLGTVTSPTCLDKLGSVASANVYSVVTHVDAGTQVQGLGFLVSRNIVGGSNFITFTLTASFIVGGTAHFAFAFIELAGLGAGAAVQDSAIQQNSTAGGAFDLVVTDSTATNITARFDSPTHMNQESGAVLGVSGGVAGSDFIVAAMSGAYSPETIFGPTFISPADYLISVLFEDPLAPNGIYYLALWTTTTGPLPSPRARSQRKPVTKANTPKHHIIHPVDSDLTGLGLTAAINDRIRHINQAFASINDQIRKMDASITALPDEVAPADGSGSGGSGGGGGGSTGFTSPLTTAGDIYTRSASADTRLGVGADGQILTADSTQITGLRWIAAGGGGGGALTSEVPTGTMDGANTTFTLSTTPTGPILLFLNGVEQLLGTDYTLSGATITYTVPPIAIDWHIAYRT